MTGSPCFLVVDDDADVLEAAAMALSHDGARVELASSTNDLDHRVSAGAYDAILLDMNFALGDRSGRDGLDCLARLKGADPDLSVVLMTTYGGVSLAVEALKRGGADFVLKPWRNEALVAAMTAAAEQTARRRGEQGDLSLNVIERRAIERALALNGGNVSHAAVTLGLTRQALYRRMARHGL